MKTKPARKGLPVFRMTWETVTPQSASNGESARSGFLPRSGDIPTARRYMPENPHRFTLREGIEILARHNSGRVPVEADECPVRSPRWFTVQGEADGGEGLRRFDHATGGLSVSLHLPRDISRASAMRIARLLNCYGIR